MLMFNLLIINCLGEMSVSKSFFGMRICKKWLLICQNLMYCEMNPDRQSITHTFIGEPFFTPDLECSYVFFPCETATNL